MGARVRCLDGPDAERLADVAVTIDDRGRGWVLGENKNSRRCSPEKPPRDEDSSEHCRMS